MPAKAGEFKDIVKSGRPKFQNNDKALDNVATGQVFSAKQALGSGLVDKTGYIEDAIDQAIKLNNLSKDSVRVVKYSAPKGLLDMLGGPLGESQRARLDRGSHCRGSALRCGPRRRDDCSRSRGPIAIGTGDIG